MWILYESQSATQNIPRDTCDSSNDEQRRVHYKKYLLSKKNSFTIACKKLKEEQEQKQKQKPTQNQQPVPQIRSSNQDKYNQSRVERSGIAQNR